MRLAFKAAIAVGVLVVGVAAALSVRALAAGSRQIPVAAMKGTRA